MRKTVNCESEVLSLFFFLFRVLFSGPGVAYVPQCLVPKGNRIISPSIQFNYY